MGVTGISPTGVCHDCGKYVGAKKLYCGGCNTRRRLATRGLGREFVGIDGEGVTDVGGEHRYVLLSIGRRSLTAEPGGRLEWEDIFEFIWQCATYDYPGKIIVGFFLKYDFTQWIRTMPESRGYSLLHPEGIEKRRARDPRMGLFPVYLRGVREEWECDVLMGKRFKLRKRGVKRKLSKGGRWITICDTGAFWQSSFLTVIEKWKGTDICTAEELEVIREGKAVRGSALLDEKMVTYNVTENTVLERVTGQLDTALQDIGITLARDDWYGPGRIAQQWMHKHGIIKRELYDELVRGAGESFKFALNASYYGGWFMITRHGRRMWLEEWDINSAYPYLASQLPCLKHGEWKDSEREGELRGREGEKGRDRTGEDRNTWELMVEDGWLVIGQIAASSNDLNIGCGLMFRRRDGSVHTPTNLVGWYWMDEVLAAQRATGMRFHVSRWWAYRPCDCLSPFHGITGMYEERIRAGKDSPVGVALKLAFNSLYGKLAQSIGVPVFGNRFYASRITSGCRRMILDVIASHPKGSDAVAMVATDGVYFTESHPGMEESNELGGWGRKILSNPVLFKPGVYWDDKAREALGRGESEVKLKSRGISRSLLVQHIGEIERQFELFEGEWPVIQIPVPFTMVSPKQALQRGDWGLCGKIFTDGAREESANPETKRNPNSWRKTGYEIRTDVWDQDAQVSHPYKWIPVAENPIDSWGEDSLRWWSCMLRGEIE